MKNFLIVAALMLVSECGIFAQDKPPTLKKEPACPAPRCAFPDTLTVFRHARFTPPVEVSAIKENGVLIGVFKDRRQVGLFNLSLTSASLIPPEFLKNHLSGGKWWIIYVVCDAMESDGEVSSIEPYDPKKDKKQTK